MAITKEQKRLYSDRVKPYKSKLDEIRKEISTLRSQGKKSGPLEGYIRIRIAFLSLQVSQTLVQMSRLSQAIQGIKNDSYLGDARKEVSSVLSDMLKLVGDNLDGSLTENKDLLIALERVTQAQRLHLLQGIRETLDLVKEALGEGSKWRWSFPDLHFKLAIVSKNFFEFHDYAKAKNPSSDDYSDRQNLLHFIVDEFQTASQEFRSRYELATQDVNDLQIVQRIFEGVKKVHLATGNKNAVEKLNTSLEAVSQRIESILAEKKKIKEKH